VFSARPAFLQPSRGPAFEVTQQFVGVRVARNAHKSVDVVGQHRQCQNPPTAVRCRLLQLSGNHLGLRKIEPDSILGHDRGGIRLQRRKILIARRSRVVVQDLVPHFVTDFGNKPTPVSG